MEKIQMLKDVQFGETISPNEILVMDKLNEISEFLNRIYEAIVLRDSDLIKSLELFEEFEKLENNGVNIFELSLRELGKKCGGKHPQTIKNQLYKYMRYKLSEKKIEIV